jgi:hypothetical protein
MFDLICALGIGMIFGFLLKKEKQPPILEELQDQVKKLEEEVVYYKDLCKWHAQRKEKNENIFK